MEQFIERMTESYMQAVEQNLDAQAAFVDSWSESFEQAFEEERLDEGYEGSVRAYEAWMNAAEQSFERMGDALDGERVDLEEFRDIWLNAANRAFKETMATTAFAAATGQNVDDMLDFQQQVEEITEETLHGYGFATLGDVREVGDRLVEIERRQHAIEQKLDRLLEEQ
jgi:hypothetical protein